MKITISAVLTLVLLAAMVWFIWLWGFCRIYVPPNHMAIVTAKTGKPLPAGQILARKGQLGVQEDVLGEGRHFLNPIQYKAQLTPMVFIPPGKIGLVTAKVGEDLPQGQFLAEKGQKGIHRQVLGPGKYRLNPAGYHIDVHDAVKIPIGYVGVITSLSGDQAPRGEFASPGQKGVRWDVLQPGLYYNNPKEFKIDILEIGLNQVSLLGLEGGQVITKTRLEQQNLAMAQLESQVFEQQRAQRRDYYDEKKQEQSARGPSLSRDKSPQAAKPTASPPTPTNSTAIMQLAQGVEFPSRDGFEIHLDMTVEFELLPKHISYIFKSFGDLPIVVDKIIMPQIQSISRLKGSAYRAIDFIVGEGREKFQNELKESLIATLDDKHIVIHNALIRHVSVPAQILDPIQLSSIAVEEDLTNKEKQNTARKLAELNTEISLIQQRGRQVEEETLKLKAEIAAERSKGVATIAANAKLKAAEIRKESAAVRARIEEKQGAARAEVIQLVEGEKARGTLIKVQAVNDPVAYNLQRFSEALNPDVEIRILHAGPGTLWTDLQNARLADLAASQEMTP